MSQPLQNSAPLPVLRRKILFSLAINGLVPYLAYLLLRPRLPSDAVALALVAAIPAVRTIGLWLWRRRVDWIGVHAVLGFAILLALSLFLNGSTFLLEIHSALLTGVIGLVLLVSAALKKPLLQPLLQAFSQNASAAAGPQAWPAAGREQVNARLAFITMVAGLVLFANLLIHIVLALTLPTATYLGVSRLATLAVFGGGLALLWWTRRGASLARS